MNSAPAFLLFFTGKGIRRVWSVRQNVAFNLTRCFSFLREAVTRLKNIVFTSTGTDDELRVLL